MAKTTETRANIPGQFITVEGVEGAGKTTNLAFIEDFLRQQNIDHLLTREPGGTPLGEEIRGLFLNADQNPLAPESELLLIFAARAQHLKEVIQPSLAQNQWVVCDRFTDATYAYQGGGRQLGLEKVAVLENLVQGELRPDLTLILDMPVELGLERASRRGELDRMERETQEFFERVRAAYLQRAAEFPERYAVIDASQPLPDVQQQIASALTEHMRKLGMDLS